MNAGLSLADRLAKLAQAKPTAKAANLVRPLRGIGKGEGEIPLSHGQKRIWAVEQINPDKATYNMPVAYRVKGKLDVEALHRSFTAVVLRHEALRTTFSGTSVETEPRQVVHAEALYDWDFRDLSSLDTGAAESEATRLGLAEVKRPMDLGQGPLVRVGLYRLNAELFILVINVHHIVSDGWSHGILIREVNELYAAYVQGRTPSLALSPLQYSDFTRWSHQVDRTLSLKPQLAYWRKQLAGPLPVLELPADRPRPAMRTEAGDVLHFTLDAETTRRLKAVSRDCGASLFMTLLSALDAVIFRLSGQTDVLVGTPIAGRNESGSEEIIGYFANTLVMRSNLEGNPTFRELVLRNRGVATEAYANQDVPFEKVVDELRLERSTSYSPVFQIMFTFQNQPMPPPQFPGLEVSWNLFHSQTAKFDLWLSFEERDGEMAGHFEFSTDLFEKATIARLIDSLTTLLVGVCQDVNVPITELPIQSEASAQVVVREFNQTAVDYGVLPTLMAEFEAQVERTPDATALVFEGVELTYREVNGRANQMAHFLIGMGVGPGELVGVATERSFEMFTALYGVLKAGAAYVPLDPNYPKGRLEFMIGDCETRVILTNSTVVARLPQSSAEVIALDALWPTIAQESDENPPLRSTLSDLAYLIYTSGSTGNPKGAMVHHAAIANRLRWHQEYFKLTAGEAVLHKTPFSFDVSVWELFWPLRVGARLVIARPEGHKDPSYLVDVIRANHVTTLHFVPTMLRVFLEEDSAVSCDSLTRVICSGEELPKSTLELCHDRLVNAEVTNLYGPTECAVDVSVYTPTRGKLPRVSIPIGVPIANTELYVLDERLTPCPIGVGGELHIAGVQVGRGYLKREALTRERFISDPFSTSTEARMYKTGDCARFLADGKIEFLGRLDNQVKVNGLRIETGEIESILLEHPDVSQALIRVTGDASKKLVAYVVPKSPEEVEKTDALDALKEEQVSHWETVFDQSYSTGTFEDPSLNLVGWNSSYDGAPLPKADMVQWLETTTDMILAQKAERILEIGCGTGLFLFRLANHCERYVGTDISPRSIADLKRLLAEPRFSALPVELQKRPAHDFSGFAPGSFDLIVINSVAQYFPSQAYLRQVIARAIDVLSENGKIFFGDIRHLGLQKAFHSGVVAAKKQDEKLVQKRLFDENELVVAPEFFAGLRGWRPEIRLKRGTYNNELGNFRYDVVLHKGAYPRPVPVIAKWNEAISPATGVAHLGDTLLITGVPNRRLDPSVPFDPSDWKNATLSWSLDGPVGTYDVLVQKGDEPWSFPIELAPESEIPAHELTNNPLLSAIATELTPRLKEHLKTKLPEFMTPSVFCFLDRFPLSPSGKISRADLPDPIRSVEVDEGQFVAPRTALESLLARVWCDVLSLEKVGVLSNFFEMGGDSIKTIQVASRASKLGASMTSKQIFENQTIESLAVAIEKSGPTVALKSRFEPYELCGLNPAEVAELKGRYPEMEDAYPFAPFQPHEMIELQSAPPSGLYAMAAVFPGTGIEPVAFEKAWNLVRSRHNSLRTTFHWQSVATPLQIVHRFVERPLEILDVSHLKGDALTAHLDGYLDKFRATPFVLESGPHHRITLFKTGENEYQFFWGFNYMVHDGWSTFLMLDELLSFHDAFKHGIPHNRPEPKKFQHYMSWLARQDHGAAESYWRKQLAGVKRCSPLVECTPENEPAPSEEFNKECVKYSREFTEAINQFCRRNKLTQSSLVFGGWALLHTLLTGDDDVTFGTVVAGRPEEISDVEGIMGHFNNMLPFRVKTQSEKSLLAWLQAGQTTHVEMRQYGFLSPVKLRSFAGFGPRDVLFQSHVVFENFPVTEKVKASFEGKDAANSRGAAQLDTPLRLELWPGDELLVIMAFYNKYLTAHAVRLLQKKLELVLVQMVASPQSSVSELILKLKELI